MPLLSRSSACAALVPVTPWGLACICCPPAPSGLGATGAPSPPPSGSRWPLVPRGQMAIAAAGAHASWAWELLEPESCLWACAALPQESIPHRSSERSLGGCSGGRRGAARRLLAPACTQVLQPAKSPALPCAPRRSASASRGVLCLIQRVRGAPLLGEAACCRPGAGSAPGSGEGPGLLRVLHTGHEAACRGAPVPAWASLGGKPCAEALPAAGWSHVARAQNFASSVVCPSVSLARGGFTSHGSFSLF